MVVQHSILERSRIAFSMSITLQTALVEAGASAKS